MARLWLRTSLSNPVVKSGQQGIEEHELDSSDGAQLAQDCLNPTLGVPSKDPEQKGSLSKRAGLRGEAYCSPQETCEYQMPSG